MTTTDSRPDHMARFGDEALISRAQADALRAAARGLRADLPSDAAAYVDAIATNHEHAADLLDAMTDDADTYSPRQEG